MSTGKLLRLTAFVLQTLCPHQTTLRSKRRFLLSADLTADTRKSLIFQPNIPRGRIDYLFLYYFVNCIIPAHSLVLSLISTRSIRIQITDPTQR